MAEAGGPTAQAGIRYQGQVAALYLGRMLDPRERARRDQPVDVRVEAPKDVDDFVVRFADGSRRFFQVKLSLEAKGDVWEKLWLSFQNQLNVDFTPDDRIELVLGEPSHLASHLAGITERLRDSDVAEWLGRLSAAQRKVVDSIQTIFAGDAKEVWRVLERLDVCVWPAGDLERDLVPLWIPNSSVQQVSLFRTLSELAWEGGAVRARFDGPTLYERLREVARLTINDPPGWGSAKYREAVAALALVEVPGTSFKQRPDSTYLWPRCVSYQQEQVPDFDDDFSGWRHTGGATEVSLENFPNADLSSVVVVAGPGFGKTTLVHELARKAALSGLLPAILSIPKLAESELPIAEYLTECVNSEFDVRVDWHAAANTGSLVLLLDGLDEVSGDRRALLLERLKVYRASHPGVHWLLTVRDASALVAPGDAKVVELALLQDSDLQRYVDFYRPGEPSIVPGLLNQIRARPDLAHLVRIPIFLALMLVLRLEGQDLRRSDLLNTYLETLFRPSEYKIAQHDALDTETLRRIAERTAFDALETDMIGVSVRQLERHVKGVDAGLRTDDVREALVRRGVLRREGLTRLAFPFPIVQEYLASAELLEHHREQLVQLLSMIVKRPWAQAIQFALERHSAPAALIDQVLTRSDDAFHTGLRLLGRCLSNGMAVSLEQWQKIGERFAGIWGTLAWRTNMLVDGVVVDAFSKPLHPAIRARLGDRRLIHHGSGRVLVLVRDSALSNEVLQKLLQGDIENLLNLAEFQAEVDRLGTTAFKLYIERSHREPQDKKTSGAIACLIGHMKRGSVDPEEALAAAGDARLSAEVRLAARSHTLAALDATAETLVLDALAAEGFHPGNSAALAMSSESVSLDTVIRLLQSPTLPQETASRVFSYLVNHWDKSEAVGRLDQILAMDEIDGWLREIAMLHAVAEGRLKWFDVLLAQMSTMRTELIGATVALFGHVLDRSRVQIAISAISSREWTAEERLRIAGSLVTGLTWRVRMHGFGSGALEKISGHPGRTAPFHMFEDWISKKDYEPWAHLSLVSRAVEIGTPGAINLLRIVLDLAMATPSSEELNDGWVAGQAFEALHSHGVGASIDELERIAPSATYNLGNSVIRLIAKGGTRAAADALIRLYGQVQPDVQLELIGSLESLAGRLGLRVTRVGNALVASAV